MVKYKRSPRCVRKSRSRRRCVRNSRSRRRCSRGRKLSGGCKKKPGPKKVVGKNQKANQKITAIQLTTCYKLF